MDPATAPGALSLRLSEDRAVDRGGADLDRPDRPRTPARLVAVVGAVGGVGTSTLAAALARALRRGAGETSLVDLHAPGAGADVLLGIEAATGARWPDLTDARGTVDPPDLLAALPRWCSVPVLSASRHTAHAPEDAVVLDVVTALVRAGQRLVLDVPGPGRWSGAVGSLVAAADAVVLLVPRSARGVAGALAAQHALDEIGVAAVHLVAGPAVSGQVAAEDVAQALGRPVAAVVDRDTRQSAAVERGDGPRTGTRTPVGRAAVSLTALLAEPVASAEVRP